MAGVSYPRRTWSGTARYACSAVLASAAVVSAGSAPQVTSTFVVPLPTVTGVPITDDSYPWLHYKYTQRPLPLEEYGFVEEEYIVSGLARVYDWPARPDAPLIVRYRDAPYATRMLVRRPADLSRFSGTVIVETMNPARRFDMAIMHGFLSEHVLDHGHAWIGVSMPNVLESLQRYDARRYGTLAFTNPAPPDDAPCAPAAGGRGGRGGGATPAVPARSPVEPGLRLDAMAQIGRWLKSDVAGNPFGATAARVFLVGHTGGDVATYVSAVAREARLADGAPVYDGFLAHSGSNAGALMNCGTALAQDDPRRIPGRGTSVPMVVMKTQNDLPYVGRPDSDAPDDIFRVYDIPGSAHADKWLFRYLPTPDEQRKAIDLSTRSTVTDHWPFEANCDVPDIVFHDFPQNYIVSGAMANLERYAQDGTPLPRAPRVAIANGEVSLDEHGNAIGGIRSVWLDVPTATYHTILPGQGNCRVAGYREDFPWWKSAALYGTHEDYTARVSASIDRMLDERWITEHGARRIRAELLPPETD
jgi:hypothetical protein